MIVFVGGNVGDTPTVVSLSLAEALMETALQNVPVDDVHAACDVMWACAFVDGEPENNLRWTADIGGEKCYVEMFTLDDDRA